MSCLAHTLYLYHHGTHAPDTRSLSLILLWRCLGRGGLLWNSNFMGSGCVRTPTLPLLCKSFTWSVLDDVMFHYTFWFGDNGSCQAMHDCPNKGALWGPYTPSTPPKNIPASLEGCHPSIQHVSAEHKATCGVLGGPFTLAVAMVVVVVMPVVCCCSMARAQTTLVQSNLQYPAMKYVGLGGGYIHDWAILSSNTEGNRSWLVSKSRNLRAYKLMYTVGRTQ